MKRVLTAAACLCLTIVLSTGDTRAQDIHFSQFYENAILRNPALTGIFSGDYKAGVNYRSQWGDIANPFQTVIASVESRVSVNQDAADYLSFGLSCSYDHAGSIDFNSLQVIPALNYNKSLEDNHQSYFSVGFAGGYIQRSVDVSKITLDNQYQNGYNPGIAPSTSITSSSMSHFDLSAGVSLNSSLGESNNINYYIGAAAYHLTRPKETFDPSQSFIYLSTKWTGNLGIQWRITPQYGLTIHANYVNQSPYREIIFGGLVNYKSTESQLSTKPFTLYAGLFYRVGDAMIPTLKLDYDSYSFTCSYDVNTSSLHTASSGEGGWEFSLFVRGKFHHGVFAKDKVRCPRFEEVNPNGLMD